MSSTSSTLHNPHTLDQLDQSLKHHDLELGSVMPVQGRVQMNSTNVLSSLFQDSSTINLDSENGDNSAERCNLTLPSTPATEAQPRYYSIGPREMLDRFKKLIIYAVDFLTLSGKGCYYQQKAEQILGAENPLKSGKV